MTALDASHAAMTAAPDDDGLRLAFYARLAEVELSLILDRDVAGETIEPRVFTLASGPVVAAFDSEERLAAFAGTRVAYAALPGRRLIGLLAGQGLGLGLNLGVGPSAFLMPSDAVDWLAATLANGPKEAAGRIVELLPPSGMPDAVLTSFDRKLARAAGLASFACLAKVVYDDGRRGHLLALIDTQEGARAALAAELGEALTFSGIDAGEIDLVFLAASDPVSARLARVGLRFDLPEAVARDAPKPPGTDPDTPPRLR